MSRCIRYDAQSVSCKNVPTFQNPSIIHRWCCTEKVKVNSCLAFTPVNDSTTPDQGQTTLRPRSIHLPSQFAAQPALMLVSFSYCHQVAADHVLRLTHDVLGK